MKWVKTTQNGRDKRWSNILPLPETESSPWARRFTESQRSSSRRRPSSPRAPGPALGEGLAHGAEHLRR
jgi:hypothetical protein